MILHIKISPGNGKLGSIPSVSLPAGTTCVSGCECSTKCYAKKLERMRPNVRDAYQHNYNILKASPETYWREVEASIMMSRFFRFHVSGDIPDATYFENIVSVAARNLHCEILIFTKKYNIVNNWISSNGCSAFFLPGNLHVVFSAWRNFEIENPYDLPVAHVRYKDGTTTAPNDANECPGNCSECVTTASGGCWDLGVGEHVVFNEH